MDDTVTSTYLLEDSLLSDDHFLTDELLFNGSDDMCENLFTSENTVFDNNEIMEYSELEEMYQPKEEFNTSDSENSFRLDIENEDKTQYPMYIEDEARSLNFSFTNFTSTSNEIAEKKMQILEKYEDKYNSEEKIFGPFKSKVDDHFNITTQGISPAKFSFKIDSINRESFFENRAKKRMGRLSMVEKYWKSKIDYGKTYSAEIIKRCLDVITIHDVEYIITRLTDGSVVPISWRSFPFLAYKKFWQIRKYLNESLKERKRRQNKRYKEEHDVSYVIIDS